MATRVGVVVFPGSNCEQDAVTALDQMGASPSYVWHDSTDLSSWDALVLPGGFSYGDYLRTGAIAAFSPIMDSIKSFADAGGPIIGICNGFQILCESGLLPGALRRNSGLKFRCVEVGVRVETSDSPFTGEVEPGTVLEIPINHFEGNFYCPPALLTELEREERIALRYSSPDGVVDEKFNPNGALANIAGVLSEGRNVLGLMPHPERAVDPAVGGTDGQVIFGSMLSSLARV